MSLTTVMTFSPDFIQRTLRTTGILLLLLFVIILYYFGFYDALALLSAGIWSMINLMFLSSLVRAVLRPEAVNIPSVIGLAIIKFPLLYAAGYFIIAVDMFRPVPLVCGFSIVLAVMALKAASRALLGLDEQKSVKHGSGTGELA